MNGIDREIYSCLGYRCAVDNAAVGYLFLQGTKTIFFYFISHSVKEIHSHDQGCKLYCHMISHI